MNHLKESEGGRNRTPGPVIKYNDQRVVVQLDLYVIFPLDAKNKRSRMVTDSLYAEDYPNPSFTDLLRYATYSSVTVNCK